jgi:hypothetical protein
MYNELLVDFLFPVIKKKISDEKIVIYRGKRISRMGSKDGTTHEIRKSPKK